MLTIIVVTLNEEVNLRRCLSSLGDLATEIVVADSGSTDGTHAVAAEFGAKWFHQDWQGFRDQKNFALSKAEQPWVLCLDADEALSAELREELTEILKIDDPTLAGASFPRLNQFLGRWIRHGDWYPDRKLRLFRRERGRFVGEPGHDNVEVDGLIVRLEADLLHYSYPTINSFIEKLNGFSDAFLAKEIAAGKSWSLWQDVTRPWWRFFRGYILRRGFLDGFPGFWIAKATAFSAFVRHSRLYERQIEQKSVQKTKPKRIRGWFGALVTPCMMLAFRAVPVSWLEPLSRFVARLWARWPRDSGLLMSQPWFDSPRVAGDFASAVNNSLDQVAFAYGVNSFQIPINEGSLFTEILNFPTGVDDDNSFEVWTGGSSLGSFNVGQSVDFGVGVSLFKITGIGPAVDAFDSSSADYRVESVIDYSVFFLIKERSS